MRIFNETGKANQNLQLFDKSGKAYQGLQMSSKVHATDLTTFSFFSNIFQENLFQIKGLYVKP